MTYEPTKKNKSFQSLGSRVSHPDTFAANTALNAANRLTTETNQPRQTMKLAGQTSTGSSSSSTASATPSTRSSPWSSPSPTPAPCSNSANRPPTRTPAPSRSTWACSSERFSGASARISLGGGSRSTSHCSSRLSRQSSRVRVQISSPGASSPRYRRLELAVTWCSIRRSFSSSCRVISSGRLRRSPCGGVSDKLWWALLPGDF